MTDDDYAQLHATKALVTAYFAASSQAEIDRVEADVRARSIGAIVVGATLDWHDGMWRAVPGGLRCGALFGERDADRLIRIAHVELAIAVLHPSGGGVTRTIPVIGPDLRSRIEADDEWGESPCDAIYGELIAVNRVAALFTDPTTLATLAHGLGGALAQLAAGWPARVWDAWRAPEPDPFASELAADFDDARAIPPPRAIPKRPIALRMLDAATGLVVFRGAVVTFRARDGKPLRVARRHPVLVDYPDFHEQQETSFLVDDRGRRVRLREVADYPMFHAFTPDHRFAWVEDKEGSGGVYRARDGARIAPGRTQRWDELGGVARLTKTGELARARNGWRAPNQRAAHAAAIVRTPRGRWLSLAYGIVAEGWRPFVVLDGIARLAAFDPDGSTLAIFDGRALRILDLATPPRQRATWPLAPLHAAAAAAKLR